VAPPPATQPFASHAPKGLLPWGQAIGAKNGMLCGALACRRKGETMNPFTNGSHTPLKTLGAQIRINSAVRRIREAEFDQDQTIEIARQVAIEWQKSGDQQTDKVVYSDMLDSLEGFLQEHFTTGIPPGIQQAIRAPLSGAQDKHPGRVSAAGRVPTCEIQVPFGALDKPTWENASAKGKSAALPAPKQAGVVGNKYVPTPLARNLLVHYQQTREDYAPMSRRRTRFLIQEQTVGTPEWLQTMDAFFVAGSIVLDQRGEKGFRFKMFNSDDEEQVCSQSELVHKINSIKSKRTKIPAFSENFQTALWDYLREMDDYRGTTSKIEQESIYMICTGADNDSSDAELKEVTEELKKMRLPPKQLCAAAIRIGEDVKGASKLARLDDPKDKNMRDIFDAPVFAEVDPDILIKTVIDDDGDEVERDSLQKMMMGLFNKELD
jgi:hypothetical protein